MAVINLYRDKKEEWRWRKEAGGHITADSGEGYKNRKDCLDQAKKVADTGDKIRIEMENLEAAESGYLELTVGEDVEPNGEPSGEPNGGEGRVA